MHHQCKSCGRPLPPDFERPVCVACAFGNALEGGGNPNDGSAPAGEAFKTVVVDVSEEASRDRLVGESFGDYELLDEIGRGGMGVVYRARQRNLNRIVAIKRILPGVRPSEVIIRRFHAEAEAAARLRHPGIVTIHEIGEHEGQPFFSMEFVEGAPMSSLVRDGPLHSRQAAEYVLKIAEAVGCAHEQGIVHRDLKPSNVLIDHRGDPKVTDFGLAKRLWGPSDLTLSGQVLGTPSFMAPEQVSSKDGKVGQWSDIYSLGAILYYAVTGRPPHQAASTEATLREVLFGEPVAPKSLNPSLPLDLQTICLKCLEKEPVRRYVSARELAEDLGRFLKGEPIRARPVSPPEQLWRWCRRKPVVASLAVSVLLLLTAITIGSAFSAYRISNTLQAERRENYFNEIARAYNFIQGNQYNRARDILNREDSAPYRGWEWGHLQWLCNQDSMTLEDAGDRPQQIAFSPDEQLLALTTRDGKLKVWNANSGALRFETTAHSGNTIGLAFSLDGQRLLTSCPDDSEVRIWDAKTGAQMGAFKPKLWFPTRLAVSPDGKWLAIGADKGVELRDAKSNEWVTNLVGHSDLVLGLAFSPDGKLLASGGGDPFPDETSKDGSIILWDMKTRRSVRRLPGLSDTVRGLAFSSDGRRLASIGYSKDPHRWGSMGFSGAMKLWDVGTGELIHDFGYPVPGGEPWRLDAGFDVAFCHNDRYLISFHLDSQIRIWNADTWTEVRALQGHTTHVHALAMDRSGKRFASASYDQTVKVWSLDSVLAPRELLGHDKPVWDLAFSADSTRLASGSWDGTVKIWNPKTRALKRSIHVGFPVVSLDFDPEGRRLVTVGPNHTALVWDVEHGRQILELKGHSNTVLSVAYSPSGNWVATGSKDNTARLWDAETGGLRTTLSGHEGWVQSVDFSSDGRFLATASGDDTVKLWEVETGKLRQTLSGHAGDVLCVRFSPDGRRIATGSSDQTVKIWDAESGVLYREIVGHKLQGEIRTLAWSPDSRRLATTSSSMALYRPAVRDLTIRIWDVETGTELLALEDNKEVVYALAFSSDGRYLASADAASVVKLFPAFPWEKPKMTAGSSSSRKWVEQWKRNFRRQQSIEIQADEATRNEYPSKDRGQPQTAEPLTIPRRDPRAQAGLLDLTEFYNASLSHDWNPYWLLDQLDHNLSALPQGIQKFLDVEFDVRGVVQLKSIEPGWERYPQQVTSIPVGRKLSALHVLHGVACSKTLSEAPGEAVGAYVLKYADGSTAKLPVRYGREVWDWSQSNGMPPPSDLKIAWKKPNVASPLTNTFVCLFQSDWANPQPDKVVQQIDFISSMTRSAPFLIAMTVE